MRRTLSLAALLLCASVAFAQTPPEYTLQAAATAVGDGTTLSVGGSAVAVLTVNCARCDGGTTISFFGTEDGTNFAPLRAIQLGSTTITKSTNTAGVSVWEMPVSALVAIKASITTYSVGTVTITGRSASTAWNSKTLDVNVVSSVMQSMFPLSLAGPPPLAQYIASNQLLYRAALQRYCSTNLSGCGPFAK